MVRSLPSVQETWVWSLGWEDPLEKEMATHSRILAWKIPWIEEPGRLQSMGLQWVGHERATSLSLETFNSISRYFCYIKSQIMLLVVKNLPANAGDLRDAGSTPGSGRSPGKGHGTPLQYSSLENPMDRRAWQATVHGVAKSWTQLSY